MATNSKQALFNPHALDAEERSVDPAMVKKSTGDLLAAARAATTAPWALTRHQAREALKRVAAGEPLREVALSYNVDHSTICRLKVRYAAEA